MTKLGGNYRYTVVHEKRVIQKDIPVLSLSAKIAIQKAIRSKLTRAPFIFGKPLQGELKGYYRLRVGNYRVIYRVDRIRQEVIVIMIRHRKISYR